VKISFQLPMNTFIKCRKEWRI